MSRAYLLIFATLLAFLTSGLGLPAAMAQDPNDVGPVRPAPAPDPDQETPPADSGDGDEPGAAAQQPGGDPADAESAEAPFEVPPLEVPTPEVMSAVNRLINQLPNKPQRRAARDQIIEQYGKQATPVMLRRMKDKDFTIRWEMVNIQGYIKDTRSITAMAERIVADPNPHVRWRGMWAMTQFRDQGSKNLFARLFNKSMESGNAATRWHAAVALTMLGQKNSIPVIYEGIDNADDWLQWEAINALGRVQDPSTIPILEKVIKNKRTSPRNRQEAALSLGRSRNPAALPVLKRYGLTDHLQGVRWRAAMSIGKIGGPEAKRILQEHLQTERDAEVREHCAKAIKNADRKRVRRNN